MGDEERECHVESHGTLVDGSDRDLCLTERTLAPPEPDADEARAFRAQKRRLLVQMFGAEVEEADALESFGHYVLLGQLGDGGMGRVYEAYDRSLDRKVAIKTLLELDGEPHLRARLVREAKAMARLTHPNVVRVYEIGAEAAGVGPYIVMEFVEGQTLREWLDARERSLAEILEVFRAVGRGLAALHTAGLVHRDVKPDNIMIDEDGRALVMDLGVVHGGVDPLMPEHNQGDGGELELRTRTGAMIGTPHYMAPEQFDSLPITERADQYSLCVSLWEAVYGERPVRGGSLKELAAAVKGGQRSAPQLSRAPAWLRAVLERGLATDPEARFESMQALVDALAEPQRRWGMLGIAALAAGVVALAALGVERWYEARAPRVLADAVESYAYALLPGGRGIVFVKDDALWHRELDSDVARQLYDGSASGGIWLSRDVGSDGSVFFQLEVGDREWELYRLRDLDAAPTKIEGHFGGYICPLVDHEMVVEVWQTSKELRVRRLVGDSLEWSRDVELEGDFMWVMDLACDDVHGRVAVLTQTRGEYELHIVDATGGGSYERMTLVDGEVHSPQFGEDGDELFYLIDRGRGFELESWHVEAGPQSTSTWSGDHEFFSFALAPDGRIAYTSAARPRVTLQIVPKPGADAGARVALSDASWAHEAPAKINFIALSPDERTLAWVEDGEGDIDTIKLLDLDDGREPRELWEARGLGSIAWSPDGDRLAYLAETEDSVRIWSIGVTGDLSAMLSTSEASESKHMIWSASGELVFQALGNRNYVVFDPQTKTEHPLVEDDSVGWLFSAVSDHRGREVAVHWSRARRGLWAIDVASHEERLLAEGELHPFGWSKDDAHVLAWGDEAETIFRVPASGGEPEVWRTIDFGDTDKAGCPIVFTNGDLLCGRPAWDEHLWLANSPRAVSLELPEGGG